MTYVRMVDEKECEMMNYMEISQRYNLKIDRHGAFGTLFGFEAGLVQEQRANWIVTVVRFLFKEPVSPEQLRTIDDAVRPFKTTAVLQQENRVVRIDLRMGLSTAKRKQAIDDTLRAATDAFTRAGLVQHTSCALCEEEGFDQIRLVNGIGMKVHDGCHQKLMDQVREMYKKIDSSTENLVKGYIFAIIGGLIGVIVNLLVMIYASYQLSLLYALIPAAAMFMYKAAKAPLRKEIPFVIAALSILMSLGMMVVLYYLIATGAGVTLGALLQGGWTEWPEAGTVFTTDLLTALLFSALGVFIMWRYLFKPRP